MSAKEHIAIIVDRRDFNALLTQQFAGVAARRTPERIADDLQVGLLDRSQVHQFSEPLQIGRLDVNLFVPGVRRLGLQVRIIRQRRDHCLDLACRLRQRRRAIGGRELDAVIFRGIMRSGEVDRPAGLMGYHCIGDCWRRRGFGNHYRRHSMRSEHRRSLGDKRLSQKSRIAAHQHRVRARLARDKLRNTGHRAADVVKGEFLGNNRAPSRRSELNPSGHSILPFRFSQ